MMIIMSVHHHHHHQHGALIISHRPYIFYIRFKCPVRHDLRCRRCADMIVMMTAGDAEDAP